MNLSHIGIAAGIGVAVVAPAAAFVWYLNSGNDHGEEAARDLIYRFDHDCDGSVDLSPRQPVLTDERVRETRSIDGAFSGLADTRMFLADTNHDAKVGVYELADFLVRNDDLNHDGMLNNGERNDIVGLNHARWYQTYVPMTRLDEGIDSHSRLDVYDGGAAGR